MSYLQAGSARSDFNGAETPLSFRAVEMGSDLHAGMPFYGAVPESAADI